MNVKIIFITISVIAVVASGAFLYGKLFMMTNPVGEAPTVSLKANNLSKSIAVPYNASTTLTWTSENAVRCLASGGWFGSRAVSGSQIIGNITESKSYILACVNDKNVWASSTVAINIDTTANSSAQPTGLSARDLFKDFSYFWQKHLYSGMKDDEDVKALQIVLFLEGFFTSPDQITGNFDEATLAAAKKFQEAYGIDPTGYVGSKTVAKLNELYGVGGSAVSSGSSSSAQTSSQASGATFNVNDYAQTTGAIKLRDNNCEEVGTVPSGALSQVVSSETMTCLINGNNYEMQQVEIASTGQVNWLATDFLNRIETPAAFLPSSSYSQTSPSGSGATSPVAITVDLKVNNRGSVTISENSSVSLSWTSENADSCKASGAWSGNKTLAGSETLNNLTQTAYYSLTCSSAAGSGSDSVLVFVSAAFPASGLSLSFATSTSTTVTTSTVSEAAEFGGMVTNVSPCTLPLQNNSIQLLSTKENKMVRYIWKMGESQLQDVLKSEGNYVPFGIPEVGMWLLGEVGEEVDCYGAGGPAKVIKYAGYGF